jgi:hypothetical protein
MKTQLPVPRKLQLAKETVRLLEARPVGIRPDSDGGPTCTPGCTKICPF